MNEGAVEPFKTERLMIGIGYKTTTDPGDAITDLTLLDMKNTHYEELDYKEFLDKHVDDFRNEAAQIMSLVNNFRQKYAAESSSSDTHTSPMFAFPMIRIGRLQSTA